MLATSVLAVGQDAASSAAHEGTTGNLSLANTGYDTHRFATLEGRQIRTSAHVDTDRYTGYAPAGAAMTVTRDGTVVADAGAATSRIPAAGVRLSESLATSHETRAAEARTLSRHWSAEAGQARNAAVTDATAMIERYSHDVSTGTAHARGITERESSQAQALELHHEKLAEIGGITKGPGGGADRPGPGRRRLGLHRQGRRRRLGHVARPDHRVGGLEPDQGIRPPARGDRDLVAGRRRLETLLDPDRRQRDGGHGREASPPTSPACAASRRGRHCRARESESWSEQAAQVRSDAQAIGRDLGQPFFAWLSERTGTDGRALGAAGAMRIASPQTAEDSEQLREHAAAFIAEKYPAPAGPDPASVGGPEAYRAEYEGAAGELRGAYGRETAAAYGGWSAGVRDRAAGAGAPLPGETGAAGIRERAETETDLIMKGAARGARQTVTGDMAREGRAGVAVEIRNDFGTLSRVDRFQHGESQTNADTPAAPHSSASSSQSGGRCRTAAPPRGGSTPHRQPPAEPPHRAPRRTSPAPRQNRQGTIGGAFLRRRDRTARPPRVGHLCSAVNSRTRLPECVPQSCWIYVIVNRCGSYTMPRTKLSPMGSKHGRVLRRCRNFIPVPVTLKFPANIKSAHNGPPVANRRVAVTAPLARTRLVCRLLIHLRFLLLLPTPEKSQRKKPTGTAVVFSSHWRNSRSYQVDLSSNSPHQSFSRTTGHSSSTGGYR